MRNPGVVRARQRRRLRGVLVRLPERVQAPVRVDEQVRGGHEPRVVRDGVEPVEERHERVDERGLVRDGRARVAHPNLRHQQRLARVAAAQARDVRLVVVRVGRGAVDVARDRVDLAPELVALVHERVEPGRAHRRAAVRDRGPDERGLPCEGLHVRHPELRRCGRLDVRL